MTAKAVNPATLESFDRVFHENIGALADRFEQGKITGEQYDNIAAWIYENRKRKRNQAYLAANPDWREAAPKHQHHARQPGRMAR